MKSITDTLPQAWLLWLFAALVCWGLSGMADGTAETLQFHYSYFKAKCPSCNDQYWWPDISWTNKYAASGNLRPKFLGSTTVFVWTTDAYHLFRSMTTWFLILGWLLACLVFMRLWIETYLWSLLILAAGYWAAKAVGFHIMYSIIF
jgi:hypothetical protein